MQKYELEEDVDVKPVNDSVGLPRVESSSTSPSLQSPQVSASTVRSSLKRSLDNNSNDSNMDERKPKRESHAPYDDLDRHDVDIVVKAEQGKDASHFLVKTDEEGERASTVPGTSSSTGSSGIVRERRVPAKIEVVLPTLEEARRQNAARREAIHQRRQVPGSNSGDVKVDPEERYVLPPVAPIGDVGDDSVDRAEALRNAVEQMRNPDAKVKKEIQFSDEFLLGALGWEGINHRYPISLPKEIAEYGFSRLYISNLYGGSTQTTFPKISEDRVSFHGLGDWAFLTLEFNPHAPTRPGHSGLFFSPRRAWDGWHGTQRPLRTFVRLSESNWVYMGEYKFVPGISLTSDEWKKQKDKVRNTWVYGVHVSQWGTEVTLRVWFRKQRGADYEPSKEEFADAALQIGDIRKQVTLQDMLTAYDEGEEEIGTYKMTCVGYDEEFVRVLQRNAHLYISPLKNAKRKATGRKGLGSSSKRHAVGKSRTRMESDKDS